MSTVTCESKLVGEDLLVELDFLSRLVGGETVATAVCAIEVWSGVDASPSAMISGSPTVSGSTVRQKVVDGSAGVIYLLTIAVRTSLNSIYYNQAKIAVLSSPNLTP